VQAIVDVTRKLKGSGTALRLADLETIAPPAAESAVPMTTATATGTATIEVTH
jgi:hypothetical protein